MEITPHMENTSTKALKEQKGEYVASLNELTATITRSNRNFTEEEQASFDDLEGKIADLDSQIATAERIERASKYTSKPEEKTVVRSAHVAGATQPSGKEYSMALKCWGLGGHMGKTSPEMRRACEKIGFDPREQEVPLSLFSGTERVTRNQTAGTNSEGGYTVSTYPVQAMETAQKWFCNVRDVATVYSTATGGPLPFAKTDPTSTIGSIISEGGSVSDNEFTFGQLILNSYLYSSGYVPCSIVLLQDSTFDLPSWIGTQLGMRIGRIQQTHFTTGDGSSKPRGFLTDATDSGITTASNTAVDWKELVSLVRSIDPAYLEQDCCFVMNSNTLGLVQKMATTFNQPLWFQGLDGKSYNSFMGYRVVVNQAMPDYSAGNKAIAFGAFKKYLIRDVADSYSIRRLNERFMDSGLVAFLAFSRSDAALLDAGTHPIKYLTVGTGAGSGSGV